MTAVESLYWVPSSCTLPTADRPLRVAEFDAVFRAAALIERSSRQELRLLIPDAGRLEEVQDLARRESSCCSFFEFDVTVTDSGDGVSLRVGVPAARVEVLDALEVRARAAVGT